MKLKKLFGGLFLSFALVAGVGAGLLVKENRENAPMEKVEATDDYNYYYNISLQGRTTSGGAWATYSENIHTNTNPHECYYENVACGEGFEILGYFDADWHSYYCKTIESGGASSNFDNNGADGNIRCKTAGVYSYYFKYAKDGVNLGQRPIYIGYGTINVRLHYMNASTGAQIKMTSTTTTSQNNFAVPAYDSISGYDRNGAVWKTTNSKTGTNYTATRLTTLTKDLYVFYTPALSVTRHALFFKDGTYMGTAQLATASVLSGGTYTYDTASDWPNGYNYGSPSLTYLFEGVYGTGNTSSGAHSNPVTGSTTINANTTIYEVFTYTSTYTITFDPNGGTGSQTSRSKTHGVDFTIPSLSNLGIDAGAARVATGWNTQSDGKGTAYDLGGTYTANAATTLHLMQAFKSFEYSVDGGSTWVQMPKASVTPDLCIVAYESSIDNYLPAGAMITFRTYYGSGTHTDQTIDIWDGNQYEYGGNHYIEFGTHNKVVLTVQNDGNFKINIHGGSERGIALTRSGVDIKYVSDLNETTHNYSCTLTVLPGDRIKAFHSWRTVYTITMTNYSAYGIDVNGNVSVPAVYTLTLTWSGEPNDYPTVDVTAMIAVDTATLIAQTFNDDMTPLCTAVEGGTAPSSLVTQWGKESVYYSKLSNDTKNILNGTTASSDGDVLAMRAKYDQIVGKYKGRVTGIDDYMSRNPASIQSSGLLGLSIFSNGQNQSLVIVIVITSLGILSVGAYFFFRKSKKSEE